MDSSIADPAEARAEAAPARRLAEEHPEAVEMPDTLAEAILAADLPVAGIQVEDTPVAAAVLVEAPAVAADILAVGVPEVGVAEAPAAVVADTPVAAEGVHPPEAVESAVVEPADAATSNRSSEWTRNGFKRQRSGPYGARALASRRSDDANCRNLFTSGVGRERKQISLSQLERRDGGRHVRGAPYFLSIRSLVHRHLVRSHQQASHQFCDFLSRNSSKFA